MMDGYAAAFFGVLGGHLLFAVVVMAFYSPFVDTGVFPFLIRMRELYCIVLGEFGV